ncbi:type II toxin-antitoxin system RelE/ParE family toxin [Propionivibrio sp.]|uniref:type II toxin-antitoxin system RelE/ParE family toxin n=1 Tax=Propionivibrio sp. TaxID=2212460 RepID=UPI003BF090A9
MQILILQPGIGRPVLDLPPEFRELVIDFGDSGYIARYHVSPDLVTVLAIRHQREVGY